MVNSRLLQCRNLEVHPVGLIAEVTAPIEAMGISNRHELANATLLAEECRSCAARILSCIDVKGGTEGVITQYRSATSNESRDECSIPGQQTIKEIGIPPLGPERGELVNGFLMKTYSAIMWRALHARQLRDGHPHDVVLLPGALNANVFRITRNWSRDELKRAKELLPIGS